VIGDKGVRRFKPGGGGDGPRAFTRDHRARRPIDPEDKVVVKHRLGGALWLDMITRHANEPATRARSRDLVDRALRELLTQRTADPSDIRDLRMWLATHG
jgi:hypothetical protein